MQPTKPPPTQEGGSDGAWVGLSVGNGKVGDKVKASEGAGVGNSVEASLGPSVGFRVGCGWFVGIIPLIGLAVELVVGLPVGLEVGTLIGLGV